MPDRHTTLSGLFSDIANAIRSKTGSSATIKADNFDTEINRIVTDPSGGCTATNDTILYPFTAYSGGVLRTGNIQTKTDSDLSAVGSTVTAPAGYYASNVSKSVTAGTQGTPSASKSISGTTATITPSCTDITGYIVGATKTGSPVTVGVGELVSGNRAITASTSTQSSIDVSTYATVSVTPTPTEAKTATANGTVTPSSGKHLSSVTVSIPVYDGSVS